MLLVLPLLSTAGVTGLAVMLHEAMLGALSHANLLFTFAPETGFPTKGGESMNWAILISLTLCRHTTVTPPIEVFRKAVN